MFVLEEIIR